MTLTRQFLCGLILLFITLPSMADRASIVSDTGLYQRPSVQSPVIKNLKAGTPVTVQSRQGGWKKVEVSKVLTGWARSYRVRSGTLDVTSRPQESGGFFSSLASLSRKASGLFSSNKREYSFQNTATIGVRGLSEEQIKNAQPDMDELKKMESFRSNKSVAKSFAQQGKLKATRIAHMPVTEVEK